MIFAPLGNVTWGADPTWEMTTWTDEVETLSIMSEM
jgi:hypothetical protein